MRKSLGTVIRNPFLLILFEVIKLVKIRLLYYLLLHSVGGTLGYIVSSQIIDNCRFHYLLIVLLLNKSLDYFALFIFEHLYEVVGVYSA
jgi:hypothetical protein